MIPVVFDLDGTLVDSAPDIHAAVNLMLADEGIAPLTLPCVTGFVGHGLPHLVRLVMGHVGIDKARHQEISQAVLTHYNAVSGQLTRPFSNVIAALNILQKAGHPMGICTNKPEAPAWNLLAVMGLARFFTHVVGGDSLDVRKPDPRPMQTVFDALGGQGVYVGDSEVDAETARRGDMAFALFSRGYRKTDVAEIPHAYAFSDFADLPGIVAQHV
ncbi:MAG: phosphoglycolate phosphatase [Rhodobacterales bacterium]|nr:MAG: phosphoglycolate phosphatase [Rhodobacterales bacterium]